VVAGLCIMGIRVQKLGNDEETSVAMVVRNMRRGLDYLFSHRALRAVLLIGFGIGAASGIYNTLTLPFTVTVLGASEFVFGVQEALTSVGFVVGSFVMASFAGRMSERKWMALSISALGIAGFFYTFSTAVPAAVLFFAIIGFFNAPAIIAIRLLFQRKTPSTLRGRVIGAYFVGVEGAIIVGMGLGGLADSFGIRTLLVVASVLTVTMGLLAALLPGLNVRPEEATDASPNERADARVEQLS
jgi:MFS family permease